MKIFMLWTSGDVSVIGQ